MPIMTRMRDSMPFILFGLLIAFLITIVFEWGMDYLGIRGGQGDVVGKVNGMKITYKEFTELTKNIADNQKSQSGTEPDETQMGQIREQVWQNFVTQYLIEEEIGRMGIKVGDQELIDWVRGENPPEDLKRNFVDSTGQFRRDVYDQFLANPNQFMRDPQGSDPEFGTKWLSGYEKNLRQRRTQEKLQSLILASVRVTDGEVRQRFVDQNEKFAARYALYDANTLVKDEEVQVTDADLKRYYEENIDQYKREASRKLNYTLFMEKPSASDSASRWKDIQEAAAKARSGVDFLQLVYTYADKPDSGAFFKHGELSGAAETEVFAAPVGSIVGPVVDGDQLRLFKVLEEKKSNQEFVHASQILFSLDPSTDSNKVKAQVQTVLKEARAGKNFAELAQKYSKDPGSAQRGGDVGWFGKGRMVPEFEKAAFAAKPGQIVGPVRTAYGFHIIKLLGRDARELKVANITVKIAPSSQTKNDLFERAKDFSYNAHETEFSKEAQQMGFEVKQSEILEAGGVIPGVGVNPAISRWAFKSKLGTVSEPFTIPTGYAVFSIAEVRDAGVRPFEEVKESLRPLALREKKVARAKALATTAREKLQQGDGLDKLVQITPGIQIQETGSFTLGGSVPGIGHDQNFLGAVAPLQPGQISPAVQSMRGAYVIQLQSASGFDTTGYTSQRETLRTRLLQEKRTRYMTDWLAKLKDKAEIEDNRDMFFR
jgi:peptidyl-prolyl cis-trans isomerase D